MQYIKYIDDFGKLSMRVSFPNYGLDFHPKLWALPPPVFMCAHCYTLYNVCNYYETHFH